LAEEPDREAEDLFEESTDFRKQISTSDQQKQKVDLSEPSYQRSK